MMSSVVPLRMVAFQCLFLLIAIAIEAYILRRELAITPRTALEYAASVNLLSTLLGWLIFFVAEPLVPLSIQLEVMNYVFFNHWSGGLVSWIVPAGFVTFFLSFFVKLQGLLQLQFMREERKEPELEQPRLFANRRDRNRRRSDTPRLATAALLANSLSFSAITLLLLFRFLLQSLRTDLL